MEQREVGVGALGALVRGGAARADVGVLKTSLSLVRPSGLSVG